MLWNWQPDYGDFIHSQINGTVITPIRFLFHTSLYDQICRNINAEIFINLKSNFYENR